ncbi:MAG: glycosyltransferase family 39 protein [Oscillospiraceae bacterium]|nr:glycosyltransferase family 39 protein [Oscillospiraceae bacterium]
MIVSILSSVIVWCAVIVILMRVLSSSGLALPKNKFTDAVLADKRILYDSQEPTVKEIAFVFGAAFLFRIIVFIFSLCVIYMFNDNVNGFDGIMEQYMKWDANNYYRIAMGGYTYHTESNGADYTTLAFFPLYPWIMKIFNIVFRDMRLSGLITSFTLYSAACCYLFKLFSIDYNKSTALRAIIYMSVFPHALFFGTIMNESMLLFTSAATLYYIRKHKWHLVGIFGAAAALSRMVGIMLAIPAAVEWLEHYKILEKLKNKNIKEVWRLFYSKGLWIFLMLLGTGIYLFCNWKVTGDPFKFLEYQRKYWNHGSAYFGTGISSLFDNLMSGSAERAVEIWIPSIVSIILVLACNVYGLRKSRNMYSAYLIVYFILNMSVDYIISAPRYMTCAIPAFLFLSDFSERHKWTEPLITASMAVGLGVYLAGYLCWKQIL